MNLRISFLQSNKKKIKLDLTNPIVVILLVSLLGVTPLIADQLSGNNSEASNVDTKTAESQISPAPLESTLDSPNPEVSTIAEEAEQGLSTTESQTVKSSPSPTKIPPYAVKNQNMIIQIPSVKRVDPRATQVNLPIVNFFAEGSNYLMLCMNSSSALIDVEAKGVDDSFSGKGIYISGDLSTAVQISGTSGQVMQIFNNFGGLKLKSQDKKSVSGTSLFGRFVAISEPTDNFSLCGQSAGSSQWLFEVKPLGLEVGTKKNPVNLGDKTRGK